MLEKERDLVGAFMRGQLSRRDLVRGLGALGVSAASANALIGMATSRALAADFDWKSTPEPA